MVDVALIARIQDLGFKLISAVGCDDGAALGWVIQSIQICLVYMATQSNLTLGNSTFCRQLKINPLFNSRVCGVLQTVLLSAFDSRSTGGPG